MRKQVIQTLALTLAAGLVFTFSTTAQAEDFYYLKHLAGKAEARKQKQYEELLGKSWERENEPGLGAGIRG